MDLGARDTTLECLHATKTDAPLASASSRQEQKAAVEASFLPPSGLPDCVETEFILFRRSPIHGLGGFARKDVAKGTQLIEYVGERIDRQESLRRCELDNPFIFRLNAREDLDGNVEWNPARFINHSCNPNCDAELDAERIWIVATRDLREGEEITFNYGYDLEDYRSYPCSCGSEECVGYMVAEEFFDHVRRQNPVGF